MSIELKIALVAFTVTPMLGLTLCWLADKAHAYLKGKP